MDSILKHSRLKARLVRTRERLTRLAVFDAFALPLGLLIGFLALIATGVISSVGEATRAVLVFGFVALILVTFFRGWSKYRPPSRQDARERLDATDPERPLSALSDHPASFSDETSAYWKKHREHLKARALALHSPRLTEDWKARDPFYLRFLLPLLLVTLVAVNYKSLPGRIVDAATPDFGALFGADQLEVSAWITPPEHTGEAPVYLASDGGDFLVPAGSMVTFRVHGGGQPKLKRKPLEKGDRIKGHKTVALKRSVDGAWQAEFAVTTPQTIDLRYWGKRGSWLVNTQPDQLPNVEFVSEPFPEDDNEKFGFRWKADDDYGIGEMALVIETYEKSGVPPDQRDRVILDLPDAYATSAEDTARLNLVRHKWAGLPVRLRLEATDTAGQTAQSEAIVYILPEKLFLEPMAKSSQEIRVTLMRETDSYTDIPDEMTVNGVFEGLGDRLAAAPLGVQRAAFMLDAVTYKPQIFSDDLTVYFGLKRAFETIRGAKTMAELAPLDDLLWSVSLRSEYGTLADAARRLEAARRALERALREGASEEEIRRLMQAYRDAAEDYIAARMAEAILNGDEGGGGGGDPPSMLGGQDLEDMLAALEDLTETGATDAARQLLDDVSNLLNNLEFQTGGEGGTPFGESQNGEGEDGTPEEQALEGALDKLSDILEEQRRLNDDTLQQRYGSGQSDPNAPPVIEDDPNAGNSYTDGETEGDGQTGSGEGPQDEGTLADRQYRILEDLNAFSEQLGEDGGAGSGLTAEEFERARRALERATNALRRGDLDAAQWNQDRAIQELRDAAGDLAEELDEQRAARKGEDGEDTINESDPLGRPAGGTRNNEGDDVKVPDEAERQRARDILDDLRDRLNNSDDPEEREYLKRLLDRFGS